MNIENDSGSLINNQENDDIFSNYDINPETVQSVLEENNSQSVLEENNSWIESDENKINVFKLLPENVFLEI